MAYSVKITGYSKTDGKKVLYMEPQWWNAEELVEDKRFVESRKRRFYCDYGADLSLEEVRELHERYKTNGTTIQRLLCFRLKRFSPSCRKLYNALFRQTQNYSHFHVNISEWEAGL